MKKNKVAWRTHNGSLKVFQETIAECGLLDLDLCGYPFTWERGRGQATWTDVRLDRAMVNQGWSNFFPDSKLFNLEFSCSDHCPLLIEVLQQQRLPFNRQFLFENAWLKDPLCYQIVRDCWQLNEDRALGEKIKLCVEKLNSWGRDYTGDFKSRF